MNIYEKLGIIQSKLKAPKGQYNSFGKYKYRSCEDILEAVKPLLAETKTTVKIPARLQLLLMQGKKSLRKAWILRR